MNTIYDILGELAPICKKFNTELEGVSRSLVTGEYHISLIYNVDTHDGSVCQKQPIEEESKPLHNLICVTDPVVNRAELDGAKEDKPDADNEVPVKAKELKEGDKVIFYGSDKTRHGEECTVVKVGNDGYYNRVRFADNCDYNGISCTQLRRKVNGA